VVGGVAAELPNVLPAPTFNEPALLKAADGVTLEDDPKTNRYPTTLQSSGIDKAIVGRVRNDPANTNALGFFSACDNLRKGAALNAVQIAELLIDKNWL